MIQLHKSMTGDTTWTGPTVLDRACFRVNFWLQGACFVKYVTFSLSVPVQLKDSSPKWPVMCWVGR